MESKNPKPAKPEEMGTRQLFSLLGTYERTVAEANKSFQEARIEYDKARNELSEIVQAHKLEYACDKWLTVEKNKLTENLAAVELAKQHYNEIGREIDCRRQELDEQKVKMGLS